VRTRGSPVRGARCSRALATTWPLAADDAMSPRTKEATMKTDGGGHFDAEGDADIALLLQQGRKIEAIRLYRERTGVGLKEAKDAVEAMGIGQEPPAVKAMDSSWESETVSLLERGQKIQAIKLYRERTGVGLREAKDAVERVAVEHGIATASGSGCLGAALVVLAVCLTVWTVVRG
jgi:ribosomal protein L7/L12